MSPRPNQDVRAELLALFKAGRVLELEQRSQALLEPFPREAFVWKVLGVALHVQGKDAVPAMRKAVELEPTDVESLKNYAAALARAGMDDLAVVQYSRVVELQPYDADAFRNLSRAQFAVGQIREAEASCRRVLELAAENPDDLSHLGVVLKSRGAVEGAVACYRRALDIDPRQSVVHNNLGVALRDMGCLEEAMASSLKALELQPECVEAYANLALVMKEAGNLVQSVAYSRQALKSVMDKFRESVPKQGRPLSQKSGFSAEAAHRTIDAMRALLDGAGIPWCMAAGTLLGVIRDGCLLPNEKDLDLALPAAVDRQRLIALLTSSGAFELFPQERIHPSERYKHSLSVLHVEHGISIDFLFLHPSGERHFHVGLSHPGGPIFCEVQRFEFGSHPWRGGLWPVPFPAEPYLEGLYGPNWRKPDPLYDTVISNPSRVSQSLPGVFAYGYAALCTRLLGHEWSRSLAICRQLLTKQEDPVLRHLELWLAGKAGAS